ncbi:MAG: hypothetical protein QOF57_640, partial [Frankiaceae bacterium]|nr:hypothetical protein [Frankiaceae bacterium]
MAFPEPARPRPRTLRLATATAVMVLSGTTAFVAQMGAAHAAIPTTSWYTVVAGNSGKCVDARAAATANGTAVQQYTCTGGTAQQWQFRAAPTAGYVVVVNNNSPNPAWDVAGPSTADGALVHLWSNGGWASQEWQPVQEANGAYHFVNLNSGKCLDVPNASTADSVQLQQYTCNGTAAQSFALNQVGGPTGIPATSTIQAESFTSQSGTQSETTTDTGGGQDVGFITNGDWLGYTGIDFGSGLTNVTARIASGATISGTIEVHVDSLTGPTVATVAVSPTGGWQTWTNATASMASTSGLHNVYLRFTTSGAGDFMNINWFTFGTGTSGGGTNPDLGPNVKIFDPSMAASSIQSTINSVYSSQQTNQFGTQRYALLFKPGTYNGLNVPVGFYTQVAGLGLQPTAVSLTGGRGIYVDAAWQGGNATQNFWRSVENLSDTPNNGQLEWAVSQAAPFRRVDVHGNMYLADNTSGNSSSNWSSGGFIADSRVSGQINSGTQQQFMTQDTAMGSWAGSNWNMVFVGDTGAPGQSFPTYTNVAQTPTVREKPFLYVDGSGLYNVFVPGMRSNAVGPSWTSGSTAGSNLPISSFYVVKAGDTSSTINAALSSGKNLLVTPGVYHLSAPLNITRANTVVLGLGMATFIPDNGVAAITTADVDGIDIAGIIVSAGTTNSPVLVQIGPAGSSANHAANPTVLHDVFIRVGGDAAGKATQGLVINSPNAIGSDLWIWRADHGSGVGWSTNTSANGLVVNGANVTMYGLFVEHFQQFQTIWNGNGGRTYFYQSEMPYDVPNNASWTPGNENGYPS